MSNDFSRSTCSVLHRTEATAACIAALCCIGVLSTVAQTAKVPVTNSALALLGKKLFEDTRLSSLAGDLQTSCASCHRVDDPQGDRAFTEALARSWHPWRAEDPGRDTLRNTPTLFDVAQMPLLHHDGEFRSLEEQVRKTLAGRNMGWLPGEEAMALARVDTVLRSDTGPDSYESLITRAFGKVPRELDTAALIDGATVALVEFMRGLTTPRNSLYDEFVVLNDLPDAPASGESARDYADRVLAVLADKEAGDGVQRPSEFSPAALQGYKVFLGDSVAGKSGNCVACHVPPLFTDFSFHNAGVTQETYDRLHGQGRFAELALPEAGAPRPDPSALRIESVGDRKAIDLGYWNFAEAATSPFRRSGESGADFLKRMQGAFKTPSLRHLGSTDPYMHNGAYPTLDGAIRQKSRAGIAAREQRLWNADAEISVIDIDAESVAKLFAFLDTLNRKEGKPARKSTPEAAPEGPNGGYLVY